MAIENVPVISADWPLFDWAGHEDSLGALVKDGPVAGFRKETWNAIVDALAGALEAAELAWNTDCHAPAGLAMTEDTDCHAPTGLAMTEDTDCHVASLLAMTEGDGAQDTGDSVVYEGSGRVETGPYGVEDCKVLRPYGALSAEMFNAVAGNISQAAPIGKWVWARDPAFRGYIGREAFRGYENYGLECDLVYPEYFRELVRRLNLLIEIMRGTAPFGDFSAATESGCGVDATAYSRKSAPMDVDHISVSPVEAPLLARKSAPLDVDQISRSVTDARSVALPPAWLDVDHISRSPMDVTLIPAPVARLGYRKVQRSPHEAALRALALLRLWPVPALIGSEGRGRMSLLKLMSMSGSGIGASSGRGTAVVRKLRPMAGSEIQRSWSSGQAKAFPPAPLGATERGRSLTQATPVTVPPVPMAGYKRGITLARATGEKLRSAKLRSGMNARTGCAATLASLWYPPELAGGVLFVRSSYEEEQVGDVLLFDTLDTPWTEPVLTDGVLTVYQSRMSGGERNLEVR